MSPRPDHLLVEMPLMLHLGAVLKPNETSSSKRIGTAAVADVVHRRNDVDRQSDQNVPGNVLERIDRHCVGDVPRGEGPLPLRSLRRSRRS